MKGLTYVILIVMAVGALRMPVAAAASGERDSPISAFDMEEQMEALGGDALEKQVPQGAQKLMQEAGISDLSADSLLELSPRNFFRVIWNVFLEQAKRPFAVLTAVIGIVVLCALVGGLHTATGEGAVEPVFAVVSILCVLSAITAPILDCIVETSQAIRQASLFMLSFVPMFAAALTAAGQPATGATYNIFLFGVCQGVAQVVSGTLIPLMGIYLALCVVAPLTPGIDISSATGTIKSVVSWALGLILTVFVGMLSVQTMVAQSADSVGARTAKFLIGSFVPVVGGALSEAYTAARGCMVLLKTSLGAYGIIVAAMTFLPIMLQTILLYLITNLAVMASDILGVPKLSAILKSCGSVLGILIAIIFCYILLIIVSTAVVMVTGLGGM